MPNDEVSPVPVRIKVHFRLAVGEDGFPPVNVESIWALHKSGDLFAIDSVPFYVGSLAWGDVVRTVEIDSERWFVGMEAESGHGTIRIFMQAGHEPERTQKELRSFRCKMDLGNVPSYFVIDVAPTADIPRLLAYLNIRRKDGVLDYAEACKTWETKETGHQHPTAARFLFNQDRHTQVFVCTHVRDGAPVLKALHDGDGDWQFSCGAAQGEDAEPVLLCFECIVSADDSVNDLARMCTDHVATRTSAGGPWRIRDETVARVRTIIQEHGWYVCMIPESESEPGFAYTIGLYETFGHPELIIFGLKLEAMHGILNHCGERIRKGEKFPAGAPVADVIADYDVKFRVVSAESSYSAHFGYGSQFYGSRKFPVLQCVWPDKSNRWPWDADAPESLKKDQPLLD